MRKLLFLAFAFVLGISAYAQTGVFQQDPNRAGHTLLFTPHKASIKKIDPAANQIWWGYQADGEERSAVGISKAETYYTAIYIAPSNTVIAGKTIKAIRFYLRDKANTNNVKIWISKSLPDDISNADYVQNVDQVSLNGGDEAEDRQGMVNDVELTTPYVVGSDGVYIGYALTITDASDGTTKFPVVTFDSQEANSLFVRTSATTEKWSDLAEEGFGKLALKILIEGKFSENSASPNTMQDLVLVKNGTGKSKLVLFNEGSAGINSIDYIITTDGVAGAEQHLDINPPVKTMGAQCTINLPVAADTKIGITEKTITITKVNGKANEAENKSATFKLTTVGKQVNRGVVVEENTGTGCGWCPRGWAGMKKMRDKFGENFVGIAIHQYNDTDPMYCQNYAKINFGGAPTCKIDRNETIDPFYGSEEDICVDFKEALARIATVGISVTGKLNADNTAVTATATIEPLVNGAYEIAYALIGDGLTGTASVWKQMNSYYQYVAANVDNDPYLSLFCKGGKYSSTKVTLVYDDVMLASSYNLENANEAKIDQLQEGKVVTNTYTFPLPTKTVLKEAIEKAGYDKLAVIAMIIRKDGKIENAAKFYLSNDPAGVEGISENKSELKEVARYTIDGRRISTPQRGLNIVKMSDGSTVKVLVK
ncbi:Omp28-related outer membrane protein [Prevotella intermedia]|uniref:Hemin-binding protein n=1 Tax=Prevotella intermedia TaxID=28131 RepID=A0A2G8ICX3_PREIN|nr:Omp28-related outer membrane protein [Prevotella intermedia]PIK21352.1 hemin-binding protein [Prevotella intermedia]